MGLWGRPEVQTNGNNFTLKSRLSVPGQVEKKHGTSTAKIISTTNSSLLHLKGIHILSVKTSINIQTRQDGYFYINGNENEQNRVLIKNRQFPI